MSWLDNDGLVYATAQMKALTDSAYPQQAAVAPQYDALATYAVGDYCLFSGLLYRCNTAIDIPEEFTEAHWTDVSVMDEFRSYPPNGTVGTITIGTEWSAANPHSILVQAQNYSVTQNTMVTILPQAEVVARMRTDGVQMIYIVNNNQTLTAYAIGNAPSAEITVPVLYSEIAVE